MSTTALAELGAEQFISLTTYRRSGAAVPTPVWVAREGDALVVTTPAGSGKVKRLRRDPRVEMRASTRLGAVADDAVATTGTASVHTDDTALRQSHGALRRKYGLQFRVVLGIERLLRRGHGRVILRITPD
jgi:uncharacterized protein